MSRKRRQTWETKAIQMLTECFGGTSTVESTGQFRMEDGSITVEVGQRVIVAGCSGRREYLRHRKTIETFAIELKDGLDQEAVCVLAFPWGESYLLLEEEPGA